ncbi:unnamed protein product, partial [Pocillopora meandrina]
MFQTYYLSGRTFGATPGSKERSGDDRTHPQTFPSHWRNGNKRKGVKTNVISSVSSHCSAQLSNDYERCPRSWAAGSTGCTKLLLHRSWGGYGRGCGRHRASILGAGARSVVVTLWAIDDEGTLEFMSFFYDALSKGKKASEALQHAMKCMKESEMFKEVQYWAPFVLIGDDVSLDFKEIQT